jgi:hypothetical protein
MKPWSVVLLMLLGFLAATAVLALLALYCLPAFLVVAGVIGAVALCACFWSIVALVYDLIMGREEKEKEKLR